MRVLMLADFYPPVVGGAERHVQALAHDLDARGHSVAVGTMATGDAPEFENDGGVRVYRLRSAVQRLSVLFSDAGRPFPPPLPDPQLVRGLAAVVAREQPDIVHAHGWLACSFLPLKARTSAPLVMTLHDYGLACSTKMLMEDGQLCTGPAPLKCARCAPHHYGLAKGLPVAGAHAAMRPWLRREVDCFVPVSQAVAEASGLSEGRTPYLLISNFIGGDEPASHGAARALPEEPFVLFVGSLEWHKGLHWLLDVYGGLPVTPPLVLIGSRRASTPQTFPAGVQVFYDWPHAAVLEAWQSCLFGVVPSLWGDPCPTVAMEALQARKPVIASRIGGLPDIVEDGESGLLVDPGDSAALRQALQQLIGDARLRERLASGAAKAAPRFQAAAVVPRIEALYRDLLATGADA